MRCVCSCTQRIWLCTTNNNIGLLSNKTTSKSQEFNSTFTLSKSPIIIHGLLFKDFYSTCPGVEGVVSLPVDESEAAQARLKGLEHDATSSSAASASTSNGAKQHKDVNTFINNQLKFSTQGGAQPLSPSQIKCNILKAKTEEQIKNGEFAPSSQA